jgi:NAD(P)-dependent dehydrogenase (short-subunit alcohol dehydrogenase family)
VAAIAAAGGEAVAIKADVTVPGDVAAMVEETDRRWGGTDVLVHNALIPFAVTSFAKLTWEQLGGKLDSELRAAFLVTKAVVPGMVSRGYGRLVYMSTGLSRRPRDGMINAGRRQGGPGPIRAVRRLWNWRRTGSPPTWSRRPRWRDLGRASNSRPSRGAKSPRPRRWDDSSVPTM